MASRIYDARKTRAMAHWRRVAQLALEV